MSNSTIFDDVLRTIQERLPEEYQEVLSKVVADSCNKIADVVYRVECQSKKDGSMILRMVEYDFMIALSDSIRRKEPLLMERMDDVMGGKVLPLPSDELRAAKDVAVERLMEEFSLTNKQANEAILKYWEEA